MPPLAELVQSFKLSSYRANLFEQIFCAELLQGCWLAGLPPVEIDRPFVDFQGYDLVATCRQVTRHIQLRRRAVVSLSTARWPRSRRPASSPSRSRAMILASP